MVFEEGDAGYVEPIATVPSADSSATSGAEGEAAAEAEAGEGEGEGAEGEAEKVVKDPIEVALAAGEADELAGVYAKLASGCGAENLSLRCCQLTRLEVPGIVQALMKDGNKLKVLNLYGNQVCDRSVKLLAHAFLNSPSCGLEVLGLSNNRITMRGFLELAGVFGASLLTEGEDAHAAAAASGKGELVARPESLGALESEKLDDAEAARLKGEELEAQEDARREAGGGAEDSKSDVTQSKQGTPEDGEGAAANAADAAAAEEEEPKKPQFLWYRSKTLTTLNVSQNLVAARNFVDKRGVAAVADALLLGHAGCRVIARGNPVSASVRKVLDVRAAPALGEGEVATGFAYDL